MTRNLKALGLALAAVFAMSALSAASAQAEKPTFTGYETTTGNPHVHTIIEGTTDPGAVERFHAGAGTVECHARYSATDLTGDTESLTVTVTQVTTPNTEPGHCNTNVPGIGNFKTHVEFTSCDYTFTPGKKLEADTYTAEVHIKCTTPGDSIHVRITNAAGGTKCLLTIPEQTVNHIVYHNKKETKPTKVTVTATAEKIKYTQTEGGILGCGRANGTYEDATYNGEATVSGFDTLGNQIDVEISGE